MNPSTPWPHASAAAAPGAAPQADPECSLHLGVIGNCAYSALVDARARIVWCCLPRFDGDPIFNALIDPSENGAFCVMVL